MNLIKFSPKWKELEQRDPDSVKLIIGYIKNVRKEYTPYVIVRIIMCYWNETKILKILSLDKRYHPWIFRSRLMNSELNRSTELSEICVTHGIKNVAYKVILIIGNQLYIHIYPTIGKFEITNLNDTKIKSRKQIYTKFKSPWTLKESNDLELKVNIYKSGACYNLKCAKKQIGSYMQIYLRGKNIFQGEIKTEIPDSLFNNTNVILVTWSQEVKKQGYTVCKECSSCYGMAKEQNNNGWIFVE